MTFTDGATEPNVFTKVMVMGYFDEIVSWICIIIINVKNNFF